MKIVIYCFLLFSLFVGRLANAEDSTPGLSLQMYGKEYKSLFRTNEINLRFSVGYNLNEQNANLNKKTAVDSFEKKDNTQFLLDEFFLRKQKLFLGLNYEYYKNGDRSLSLFSKPKYTEGSYFTFTATPKALSAVVRYNF